MSDNAFADAEQMQELRLRITAYAAAAVQYGNVDRGWANRTLRAMGAEPVVGYTTYQLNIPVTGLLGATVKATDRAHAQEKFNELIQTAITRGIVDGMHCIRLFGPQVNPAAGGVQFYSGPADDVPTEELVTLDLDGLKSAIREMLKTGVTEHGWGLSYATAAIEALELEPLPTLHLKNVQVPVSGTSTVQVPVFDGDDNAAIQRATAAKMHTAARLIVTPDEVGEATWARPSTDGAMGLHLIDDDEDEKPY